MSRRRQSRVDRNVTLLDVTWFDAALLDVKIAQCDALTATLLSLRRCRCLPDCPSPAWWL
jgi:hypothetical protein